MIREEGFHNIRRKAVLSGTIGNIREWYDFGVYAYFASVIGKLFFPAGDQLAQLLASFAVFAVGFLARPLGAILFGHYGDKAGRRNALAATVVLMGLSTLAIGLMPTYSSIGVLAPILLVTLRLLQGLSAGGEWGGSASFMVEYAPEDRRGFIGSFQQVSTGAGLLLGSLTAAVITSSMGPDGVIKGGWRIPFILGVCAAIVGFFMRRALPDTPKFQELEERGETVRSPLVEVVRQHPGDLFKAFGFTVLWTVSYYAMFTFTPSYLSTVGSLPQNMALTSNSIQLLVFVLLVPLMGALSDRIGRKPLLIGSALGFALFTYPAFLIMSTASFATVVLCQVVFAILLAMFSGPGPAAIAELFPTRIRYSALSIGYNFAVTLFGGTAPFISTWLVSSTQQAASPAYYVVASALVTLVVLLGMKESHREALQ